MCVTHLPQVAGCGHQHLFVSKQTDGTVTETQMAPLDKRARLQELARLLGGSEVTRNTLANAKELLAAKSSTFSLSCGLTVTLLTRKISKVRRGGDSKPPQRPETGQALEVLKESQCVAT